MKRLHVHIRTKKLENSIAFYTALFGKKPDRLETDYAKWLLDDPAANIAVSTRAANQEGVDHLGISVDTDVDLEAYASRLKSAGADLFEETATTCCYARSNKYWVGDDNGARWELFHSFGDAETYGEDPIAPSALAASACCSAG